MTTFPPSIADQAGREAEVRDGDVLLLGDAERPVRLRVQIGDEPDDARIVSVRKVDELAEVEATVGADRDVLQSLYEAQKAIETNMSLGW